MSAPIYEAMVIDAIDLDAPIPCTHSEHATYHADEPAAMIVNASHGCGLSFGYPLCKSGWDYMFAGRILCHCGESASAREVLRVVEVLR
jgi:hypothetical protein